MGFLDSITGAKEAQQAAQESSQSYADAEDHIFQAGRTAVNRFNPFYDLGSGAANRLNSMYSGSGGADYGAFRDGPGYQFRLEEGQRAVDNSGAARGMTQSGAQLKALQRYGQGTADQGFNNWFAQQMQMSGQGQSAANSMAGVGMSAANSVGQMKTGGGDARASGYLAKGAIKGGLFNTALNAGMAAATGGMSAASGGAPSGGGIGDISSLDARGGYVGNMNGPNTPYNPWSS